MNLQLWHDVGYWIGVSMFSTWLYVFLNGFASFLDLQIRISKMLKGKDYLYD